MTESISSKYKVPANLRPLLEAFARETLRTQPPDLIQFGRIFFETLHSTQKSNPRTDVIAEEKLYNQFRINLQHNITTRSTSDSLKKHSLDTQLGFEVPSRCADAARNYSLTLPPLDLHSQRHDSDATLHSPLSQTTALNQLSSKSPSSKMQPPQPGSSGNSRPTSPEALAATKIQAAYRGHFVRNHPEKFGIDILNMSRRRSNDYLTDNKKDLKRHSVGGYSLVDTKNSPDDRAATKIQAEIRGFLARKHVEAMKKQNSEAATKIQAHIRGFLTRKNLNKDNSSRSSTHSNEEVVR